MQPVFSERLTERELPLIKEYLDSCLYCSIYQFPGWTELFFNTKKTFFYLLDEGKIVSFCQVNEILKSATIIYGPVCDDKDVTIISLIEIINYYKKRGFYYIGIKMYRKSNFDLEFIEYKLNKQFDITYVFDSENTKSSIEIDLSNDIDKIWEGFREGHKKSIKKAIKVGITVDVVRNASDLKGFVDIHSKMCNARKIPENKYLKKNIGQIYDFLLANKRGEILISKDKDGIIIGGDMLVYQGVSVTMFLGSTDPDRRDLPASHLLIYEAIKKAKNDNFKFFDFGGYNHFVDEHDQVFNINQFKKGFGGDYIFFAKNMNINLIPYGYKMHGVLSGLKGMIKRL